MKRLIMCAVMSVGSALAGMFGVSGYIEADAVTGVQSQQLAQVVADFAVEPLLRIQGDVDGTNYVDAMRAEFYTTNAASQAKIVALQEGTSAWNAAAALAATALQPSWAVTGTVSRAHAAMMLASADGDVWTEIGTNGTLYLVQAVKKITLTGAGEPLADGDYFSSYILPAVQVWAQANNVCRIFQGENPVLGWNVYVEVEDQTLYYSEYFDMPFVGWDAVATNILTNVGYDKEPAPMLQYSCTTNRYQIATQVGTVFMLSAHDGDPTAHPTLPRSNDVVNIVGAATNPLLSKAEAAATYLPLANIPGPGCTDLGTSNYFDVSGSTIYYRGTMSGISTATVTKAVSEGWTYALTVVGTNTLVLSNATLLNTWTLGGTNTYVFTPSTTNAWQVRGMTP